MLLKKGSDYLCNSYSELKCFNYVLSLLRKKKEAEILEYLLFMYKIKIKTLNKQIFF